MQAPVTVCDRALAKKLAQCARIDLRTDFNVAQGVRAAMGIKEADELGSFNF
jgi:hypothetical protein